MLTEERQTGSRMSQALTVEYSSYRSALLTAFILRALIAFGVFLIVALRSDAVLIFALGAAVVAYSSLEMAVLKTRMKRAAAARLWLINDLQRIEEADPQLAWLEAVRQLERLAQQAFEREAKWDPTVTKPRLQKLAREKVSNTIRDFLEEWQGGENSGEAQEQIR